MKNLDFTVKDLIKYAAFIFALGAQFAANSNRIKILEQKLERSNEINVIRLNNLQEAVRGIVKNQESDRLNLRKLELEVAEIKYKK